jgi:NMD protein affecting ribosome stability and mRNA decay
MGFQMKQANLRPRRLAAARRIAGHAQEDHILDPYQRQQKLEDNTVCPQCGAVYHKGRWRWGARLEDGYEGLCPACRRINDKYPAGVVELRGGLERQQKEEIVRLARHQEEAETSEHPLNRIINIEEDADGIIINTTDIHLPRRIGEAVERAFHGSLNEVFDQGGYFVRVTWTART